MTREASDNRTGFPMTRVAPDNRTGFPMTRVAPENRAGFPMTRPEQNTCTDPTRPAITRPTQGFTLQNCAWIALNLLINLVLAHTILQAHKPAPFHHRMSIIQQGAPVTHADLPSDLDDVLALMHKGTSIWSHEQTIKYMETMKKQAATTEPGVADLVVIVAFQKPRQIYHMIPLEALLQTTKNTTAEKKEEGNSSQNMYQMHPAAPVQQLRNLLHHADLGYLGPDNCRLVLEANNDVCRRAVDGTGDADQTPGKPAGATYLSGLIQIALDSLALFNSLNEEEMEALDKILINWRSKCDMVLVLEAENPVGPKLVAILARLGFKPYNSIDSRSKQAANYLDHRLGTLLVCLSQLSMRKKREVYAPSFTYTTSHFRTPVRWTDLWASKFPGSVADTPGGTGYYSAPFLTAEDNGAAVKKPSGRALKGTVKTPQGFLHTTILGTNPASIMRSDAMPAMLIEKNMYSDALSAMSIEENMCTDAVHTMPNEKNYNSHPLTPSIWMPEPHLTWIGCSTGTPFPITDTEIQGLNLTSTSNLETFASTIGDKFKSTLPIILDPDYTRFMVNQTPSQLMPNSCTIFSGFVLSCASAPLRKRDQHILTPTTPWQLVVKGKGADHRSFPLPEGYTADTTLLGHERAIGQALFKAIGEFSLPSLDKKDIKIFPKGDLTCTYMKPQTEGADPTPCGKQIGCEYLKFFVGEKVYSTPHRDLGIHAHFGSGSEGLDCVHFICLACLPKWHKSVVERLGEMTSPATGSSIKIECFHENCAYHVGSLMSLEETMRIHHCNFESLAVCTKSPQRLAQSTNTPVDGVSVVAPAIIDPRHLVGWATKFSNTNFSDSVLKIFSTPDLINSETDEWGEEVDINDAAICTSEIIFNSPDGNLGTAFAAVFTPDAISEPERGCLRYIETALDIDVNDFPVNSQIIVDPINSTEHPIRAMQRANSEVKRALEWPAAAGAKRSKQESSLTSASTVAYSPAPSETKPAEGGAAKSPSKGAAGGSPT